MGSPPPIDAPPPGPAVSANADAGFADDPSAATLCGFTFPPFPFFKFGFSLAGLKFPPALPIPKIGLAINCDLNNPLSVTAGVAWGGGRNPNGYPDPDAVEQGL